MATGHIGRHRHFRSSKCRVPVERGPELMILKRRAGFDSVYAEGAKAGPAGSDLKGGSDDLRAKAPPGSFNLKRLVRRVLASLRSPVSTAYPSILHLPLGDQVELARRDELIRAASGFAKGGERPFCSEGLGRPRQQIALFSPLVAPREPNPPQMLHLR